MAALAGHPRHARQAGEALRRLSDARIPWHRVINAKGEVSPRGYPGAEADQRRRLEREGVRFTARGRVDFRRYGWFP